jgi:YjbE family integral membrane protein
LNWFSELLDPSSIGGLFRQFSAEVHHPEFWLNLSKIIWINVLLSGDNALVVALACRGLEPRQRLWGMVLGAAAAVLLRIIFTGIVTSVMGVPYLKFACGLALIVIAAKLLVPEEHDEDSIKSASHLWSVVRIVAVADIVMSLDNVIAVAAAANGSVPLLVFGLASSIPLIIAGAALIMALLNVLPILVWAGSALLGWIAGEVMATDPAMQPKLEHLCGATFGAEMDALLTLLGVAPLFVGVDKCEIAFALLGGIVVLIVGAIWRRRSLGQVAAPT